MTWILGLSLIVFGCDGGMAMPDAMSGPDASAPDGGGRDTGGLDGGADAGDVDAGGRDSSRPDAAVEVDASVLPPTEFRGIPQRPYADVVLPATGTVEQGATSCIGTAAAPAFMIGDGVEFTTPDGKWEIDAQFCIIANINYRGRLQIRGANMVELRDSEVGFSGRAGIALSGTDLAVIDSHIHHASGNNGHGVTPGCGSSRIWVGGNLLEYNDEDGFQSGHNCDGSTPPDEIYFYGNTCNNNRENCFDIKWTNRSVVSGNVMRRHRPAQTGVNFIYDDGTMDGDVNSGSDGSAVVIGSDGTPTTTFLFDNIYHDNMLCVRVEDAVDVYASGEDCRDALPEARSGGYKFDKSGRTRLVASTFTNVPFMITDNWRSGITIDEADNTVAGGTEFRQGFNATLNSGSISDATIVSAYTAAFGRAP